MNKRTFQTSSVLDFRVLESEYSFKLKADFKNGESCYPVEVVNS